MRQVKAAAKLDRWAFICVDNTWLQKKTCISSCQKTKVLCNSVAFPQHLNSSEMTTHRIFPNVFSRTRSGVQGLDLHRCKLLKFFFSIACKWVVSFWKYDIEAFTFPFPSKGSEPAWLNSSWCFPFSEKRKQALPIQQHCQQLVQPSGKETLPPVWHPQISQASNMWPVLSRGRMIARSNITWLRRVACSRHIRQDTHTASLFFV